MSVVARSGATALTGRQKAAVFLITIGTTRAADVLKFLSEREIEAISAEILRHICEGFRVIVMPTGASWGASRAAQDAIDLLPEDAELPANSSPAPSADKAPESSAETSVMSPIGTPTASAMRSLSCTNFV